MKSGSHLLLAVFFLITFQVVAQEKPGYVVFTKEGRETSYGKIIKAAQDADIILFGELHNNSINHWLELQILKDLYKSDPAITIGMEMFEADNQLILNEYLNGVIEERHLLNEAKVWDNYKTDYKPIVEFARTNKLPVIATNVPRRYANLVYRKGVDALTTLPAEAKNWIAPLPIEIDLTLPGYKNMMAMATHSGPASGSGENMAKSQAVKDATMAYFILANMKGKFIHYHGAYHSQNFDGIVAYLRKAKPELKILTIHSVEQVATNQLEAENEKTADFILCFPADMTKTY